MKRLIFAVACIVFLTGAASSLVASAMTTGSGPTGPGRRVRRRATLVPGQPTTDEQQFLLELAVYRVRGNISVKTLTVESVPPKVEREKAGLMAGPLVFVAPTNCTIAGMEFRADENGWTWDGKKQPPSNARVEIIACPRVLVCLNNSFGVSVVSQQPLEYFEKRPDGLFELKRLDEETGLTIKANVAEKDREHIILRDLTIRLRSIEAREPIEGVSLDVGRPSVGLREFLTTIAVHPGGDFGILLGPKAYGSLLVRAKITRYSRKITPLKSKPSRPGKGHSGRIQGTNQPSSVQVRSGLKKVATNSGRAGGVAHW